MLLDKIYNTDCLVGMRELEDNSIDAIVTDPPYGLSFMGKKWDYDVPTVEIWAECLRVLKPGGYLLAFAGTRTQHRMAVRIEDAGFEIRDMIAWVYGSGFPKSLNIGKAVDKIGGESLKWFIDYVIETAERKGITRKQLTALFPSKSGGQTGWLYNKVSGKQNLTVEQYNKLKCFLDLPFNDLEEAKRELVGKTITNKTVYQNIGGYSISGEIDITKGTSEWEGWGTALKPAFEPITVARKPIEGTVAENCLKWGVGGINIDGCRVGTEERTFLSKGIRPGHNNLVGDNWNGGQGENTVQGRFPANFIHDGSEEVLEGFPQSGKGNGGSVYSYKGKEYDNKDTSMFNGDKPQAPSNFNDSGSAARFFYCAKASKSERNAGGEELEEKYTDDSRKDKDAIGCNNHNNRSGTPSKNFHPTVKPIDLMEYLIKLVSREGQIVLDPFIGSGTTAVACVTLNRRYIGFELSEEYCKIAEKRIGADGQTSLGGM